MTGPGPSLMRATGALLGPTVWAAYFLIVYASESLVCRFSNAAVHTALLAFVTLLALAVVCADLARQLGGSAHDQITGFIAAARLELDVLSVLAILLLAAAGFALPACSA